MMYIVIPFYLIARLAFIYHLLDFLTKGLSHFGSIYKYLDLGLYPCALAHVTYLIFMGNDFLEDQFGNLLVSFIVFIAVARTVSLLRILETVSLD